VLDTTTICDAAKDARVMSGLVLRSRNPFINATAVTVRCRDDFFGSVRAIERAQPGQVVVVDGGGRETALAGEMFTRAARNRGLAGIIVDAGCRDLAYIADCDLPFYSRHVTPLAGTSSRPGVLDEPVTCGGVCVRPGDLVVADRNGIVVLDPAAAPAQLAAAAEIKAAEARAIARLDAGASLRDCFNVDEHAERLARGEPSTLRFTAGTP
jgi:regulator of RNase E activity RraA